MKVQRPVRKDVGEGLPETVCINFYVLKDPTTLEIRYVGQTVNPENRFRNHLYEARKNKRTHKDLWILKLLRGNKKPIMEIIGTTYITSDDANKIENKLIKRFKNKYRLTNNKDRSRNASVIETVPVFQFTLEGKFVQRFVNAHQASLKTGVHDSSITVVCSNPEGRRNRSRGGFLWSYSHIPPKPLEKDYRSKISAKKTNQLDLEGNIINVFDSTRIASKTTGVCWKRISACATGRQKTAGGFKWKFDEDMV